MRKTRYILFLLFFSVNSFAGSISGGEIIYDYLGDGSTPGSSRYKITLRIFVNLNTPGAEIPVTALLAIFVNYTYYTVSGSPFRATQTDVSAVPVKNPVKCTTNAPPSLNFRLAEYVVEVELPYNSGGYTVSYQGVNREKTFENVEVIQYEPPEFNHGGGSTFTTQISGYIDSPMIHNNSPRFNTTIESICRSSTLSYDFGATDPDGDRLEYYFDKAYNGGSAEDLYNASPAKPPYRSVSYINGFNGNEPLGRFAKIDKNTGLITGVSPNSPGNYVVSVLIYEFRGGNLISFHRKDITVVVGSCTVTEASLQKTYINCKDYTFYFSNLVFPPGILTYDWYFGDGNHSTASDTAYTYTNPGIYTLKLFINKGLPCVDSAIAEVRVFPGFYPDFEALGTCKDFPIQFNDKSTADHGVINKWAWDFGNGTGSTLQNTTRTFNVAKDYVVMLTVTSSVGCWATATKVIKIDNKPAFKMSPGDTLICSVDTLQIAAVGTGTAVWSPPYNINNVSILNPLVSPDVTTTYKVFLTDPYGCTGTDSVKVRVVDKVTQYGDYDTTICQTDKIKLRLVSDAIYFTWTPNDGSLNDPLVKNPIANPLVNTDYKVIGKISNKCYAENTVSVKAIPYPKAIADDVEICLGQSTQLQASGGSIYNWSPAIYLNNVNIANPLVTNPAVGVTYKLTVRDVLGCPKPVQKNVKLNVLQIKADAGPCDTAVVLGQLLQLNATGGNEYLWMPDNNWLSNTHINNPVAFPQDNINYIVKVSNPRGCFAYDTIRVKLYKLKPGIYLPNAFTPNNDSRNDYFKPIGIGVTSLTVFQIYNRIGQLIYNSTDRSRGWDGTFKGQKVEPGTYIWITEAIDYNNKKITSRGSVIVIK